MHFWPLNFGVVFILAPNFESFYFDLLRVKRVISTKCVTKIPLNANSTFQLSIFYYYLI